MRRNPGGKDDKEEKIRQEEEIIQDFLDSQGK